MEKPLSMELRDRLILNATRLEEDDFVDAQQRDVVRDQLMIDAARLVAISRPGPHKYETVRLKAIAKGD